MKADIEQALAPLVGLRLWRAGRTADLLQLQFGERLGGEALPLGAFALHIACPWRLVEDGRLLVGSGDLLTPSDPDADLETFDWDEPGANWQDVRLAELWEAYGGSPPLVLEVVADALGGLRLVLDQGRSLDLFPNATPTGHVSTEFWRLVSRRTGPPDFVVGTFGITRE